MNEQAVQYNAVHPTQEQMQAFLALPDSPVVMMNLVKFKPAGGAGEYAKYAAAVAPLLKNVGGKVIFNARGAACFIGNADWDAVFLVEYPNPAALMQMVQSEDYQAIHHHREAGLEGQVNYAIHQSGG